jgi:hypothetical protein
MRGEGREARAERQDEPDRMNRKEKVNSYKDLVVWQKSLTLVKLAPNL